VPSGCASSGQQPPPFLLNNFLRKEISEADRACCIQHAEHAQGVSDGGLGVGFEDMLEDIDVPAVDPIIENRVLLDEYYVRHWSIWLDFYILMRTLWTVVTRKGAY